MIRFSTRQAASFLMMDKVVESIFQQLDLEFHVPGIWTHDRLEGLIEAMEALQTRIRAQERQQEKDMEFQGASENEPEHTTARISGVSLASRLVPLIAMLRLAHEKEDPVIWEANSSRP